MAKVINCGHRGAMEYEPENTLRSFRCAAEKGAEWVELDVRLAGDGTPVVSHDARVDTSPYKAVLKECTVEDIKQLWFLGEEIPTLEEALGNCLELGLRVNVELKETEAARESLKIINRLGMKDRCMISSFKIDALKDIRKLEPGLTVALLAIPVLHWQALRKAAALGFDGVNPYYRFISPRFVKAAHGRGLSVNVWTVNTEQDMRKQIEAGVDMIITNVPDVLVRVKEEMKVE